MLKYKLRTKKIEELVELAQEGLEDAMALIIEKYYPMVLKISSKYYGVWSDFSDLVQNGLLGLMKAVYYYNPEKSSFSSFAWTNIESELKSFLTYLNRKKNQILTEAVKVDAQDVDSDEPGYLWSDTLEEGLEDRVLKEYFVEKTMDGLNDLERNIVKLWAQNYTYEEIKEKLNVNVKKVDNTIQKLKRLAKKMGR